MRLSAKRDKSEPAIVQALEAAGCVVRRLNDPDIPDLLVALPDGQTVLIECKSAGGKLRPNQADFLANWPGRAYVCYSADEALQKLGLMEKD